MTSSQSKNTRSNGLNFVGSNPTAQEQFVAIIHEIVANSDLALQYEDDFLTTADHAEASAVDFVKELTTAFPVYSANESVIKVSFIGRDDQYWAFELSKIAFLEIVDAKFEA